VNERIARVCRHNRGIARYCFGIDLIAEAESRRDPRRTTCHDFPRQRNVKRGSEKRAADDKCVADLRGLPDQFERDQAAQTVSEDDEGHARARERTNAIDHSARVIDVLAESGDMGGNTTGVSVTAEIEEVTLEIMRGQISNELTVSSRVFRVSMDDHDPCARG
jgi:hypothetical protein